MTVVFFLLAALALFLTLVLTALAHDLRKSDAAGNGLTSAFSIIGAIALWCVLGLLLLVASGRSEASALRGLLVLAGYALGAASTFVCLRVLDTQGVGGALRTVLRVVAPAPSLVVIVHALATWFAWPVPAPLLGAALLLVCTPPWVGLALIRRESRRPHPAA